MKRILAVFLVLAAATVASPAQTQADRDRAVQYLEKTRQGVADATKGLTPAQWSFKPGPDRWSAAEVMEHIAAAEDLLFGVIQEQAMKAPARPAGEDVKAIDDFVLAAIPDRTHKAQAPEPLKPTNRFGSPEEAFKHFEESRAKTEEFVKTGQGLRDHASDSPLGKKLDPYEWVLFISAHSERHTKQILEVKADPNFPKS
jgi:phage shock protein A